MIMRFPHPDRVVLPLLQSVYCALAAYAESRVVELSCTGQAVVMIHWYICRQVIG